MVYVNDAIISFSVPRLEIVMQSFIFQTVAGSCLFATPPRLTSLTVNNRHGESAELSPPASCQSFSGSPRWCLRAPYDSYGDLSFVKRQFRRTFVSNWAPRIGDALLNGAFRSEERIIVSWRRLWQLAAWLLGGCCFFCWCFCSPATKLQSKTR